MKIRSHVSRDVLQAAGMFRNERLMVWEYVSNGLQYVDPAISPVVTVRILSNLNKITINDNGRGMDWSDLSNFFIMHGENMDRREGRPGRGMFGTGKSAAFGIGDKLTITSRKNGKMSKVQISRKDLEENSSGEDVPVKTIIKETVTDKPSGTLIEVDGISLKTIDQQSIIEYIERHLAKWPRSVTVTVNNHRCELIEPSIDRIFEFKPSDDQVLILGPSVLTIKVSKSPLDNDTRGISIFSKGVWHETTSLSSANKEMSEFIYGEIDIPALEDDKSIPPAFDASRSVRLNAENKIVRGIYDFIGPKIEEVRKTLAEESKVVKASEEARRLSEEASKIENIINNDFDAFRVKLQKAKKAVASGGFDPQEGHSISGEGENDDFLYGGLESADITEDTGGEGGRIGIHNNHSTIDTPRRLNPIVAPNNDGISAGHYSPKTPKTKPRGGFQIIFHNSGEESPRAKYDSDQRTIFINLDHPQIAAAKMGRTVEDAVFRRLTYEVAFTEYAIALASELNNHGEYIDISDPIYDIRESINRVAKQAASLYS